MDSKQLSLKIHLKFVLVVILYSAHIYFRRLPVTLLPLIRAEIELSSEDVGLLVSTHALCYTIGRLLFGIASDRYSRVNLLLLGLFTCASSSVFISFSNHRWQLLISQSLLGIVQGAGWVPATLLIQKWYSESTYGTMFSILTCGGTFAGIMQPFSKHFNWRNVEFYTGIGMLIFGIFCWLALREDSVSPIQPKNDDDDVEEKIKNKKKTSTSEGIMTILGSYVVWHIAFVYLFTMETRAICETWIQLYLTDLHFSPDAFQITYEIGGLVGTMLSGIVIDVATKRFDADETRRFIAVVYTSLMMFSSAAIFELPNLSSLFGFLAGMFVNGSINVWCLIAAQAGNRNIQGTVSAFISFVASSGSMLAGSPLAFLIDKFGYNVFLYIFLTQFIIVLFVSAFRIRLRMEKKVETSSLSNENDEEIGGVCSIVIESNRNLTDMSKKNPISMMFNRFMTTRKIEPIRETIKKMSPFAKV